MPPPDSNNNNIQPPLEIQILEFIQTLGYDEDPETKKRLKLGPVRLPILQILWVIVHSANLDFASLNWDEFEWQRVKRSSRPSKMYKLLYTRFTKLIIDYLLSVNKSIPRKSDSKLHMMQSTTGYTYYMARKVESKKAKIVDKPEEQHVSLIKSERRKGFMCYGDQVANVPNKLKKDVVLRKTRSLTIAKELVISKLANSVNIQEMRSQQYTDSDATIYSSSPEGSANETDDADESDMNLSDDNPHGYDNDARYEVFMHNKSTATPNSTYLSLTVTSSSLDFIQNLLDETPANELMDFMSHPMYTDAQTTSVMHNPEGNPELKNYISGASEVPLGTHVDVLATKTLMQEMFSDDNAHLKKLMQKAKKTMRKFNFKKAVAQKLKEYDHKLEALTNFNVSEAFEKVIQAKDPLNNREGENEKKRRKDVSEPSSRSSRRNRSPVVIVQDDTPAM
ncbi:hypothetical protein Tco_1057395, partial [Tanacetum coccineum]